MCHGSVGRAEPVDGEELLAVDRWSNCTDPTPYHTVFGQPLRVDLDSPTLKSPPFYPQKMGSFVRKIEMPYGFFRRSLLMFISSGFMLVTGCGNLEEGIIEKPPEVKADPAGKERMQAATRNPIIDELQQEILKKASANFNFAPSLLNFSSSAIFDPDLRQEQFELLGVAPNAKQGNLAPFLEWASGKGTSEKLASDLQEATTRAWDSAEFPLVDQWLSSLEPQLHEIKFYPTHSCCVAFPLSENGPLLDGVFLQHLIALKAMNDALLASALRKSGPADNQTDLFDLLLALELSWLYADGPLTIDYVFGSKESEDVYRALTNFVLTQSLSTEELERLKTSLGELGTRYSTAHVVELREKYRIQAAAYALQKKMLTDPAYLKEVGFNEELLELQERDEDDEFWRLVRARIESNLSHFRRTVTAESPRLSKTKVKNFLEYIEQSSVPDDPELGQNKQREAERASLKMISVMFPKVDSIFDQEMKTIAARSALYITIELMLYKEKNGRFPEHLDEIANDVNSQFRHADPFGDGALVFKSLGDKFQIYSIGANGTDDGGAPNSDDFYLIDGSNLR